MKTLLILLNLFLMQPNTNVYDFQVTSIEGTPIDLAEFRGKKILIVNTASECGFTPQYEELEALSKKYGKELVVIGFPANNFGGQEPGSNSEIQTFCEENYGVTFPLSQKVSVKGDNINALFAYLTGVDNPDFKGPIKWNFEKFLIDENGKLIHRFRSNVTPLSEKITQHI